MKYCKMRKKSCGLSLLIIICLTVISCKKDPDTNTIVDVEKEFNIQPWEKLTESGGTFQLQISTVKNQDCGGTGINTNFSSANNKFVTTILSLKKPATCGSLSPAQDSVELGQLPKGTYAININLRDVISNAGVLTVEDQKFRLDMNKIDGINVPKTEIFRIPKGLIWGSVSFDNTQNAILAKFLDKLSKIATSVSDIPKGDYGYFNIKDALNPDIKGQGTSSKPTTKSYIYSLTSNNAALESIVKEYRDQGLELKFYTSDGKIF